MASNKQIEFKYHVCAVLFGTDETILNVSLADGFSFVKKSLHPKDHLDQVFDTNDNGLRRAYETARIDDNTLDVICIEKYASFWGTPQEAGCYFDNQVDTDLISLDNQIRAVRLIRECTLRCRIISYRMIAEEGEYGPLEYNAQIPISESSGSPEISTFHCDSSDLAELNYRIQHVTFPITNETLNVAHRFYDRSYLEDNYIALTLLIVSLEMIFLTEQTAKKERLSKRCAMFMYTERLEQIECYNKLTNAYKQRSDFVHDGKFTGIDNETIIFLRECVRKVLLSVNPISFNKTQFDHDLKMKVDQAESSIPSYWTT